MTMKIEVTIPEDEIKNGAAAQYLARSLSAIGFSAASFGDERMSVEAAAAQVAEAVTATEAAREAAETVTRERGKPATGRARRTKEEIAEDEAADKADASNPAAEPVAAISTGEERIDPATVEDEAQDAADEAAEAEATKPATLTHDDVRAALKGYLDAFGTPAAMEDGPKVLKMLFGEGASKVSDVPDDQASLAKAVAGIKEMLVKNPFGREAQL